MPSIQKLSAQALTRLVVGLVQVYVASTAALSIGVHVAHVASASPVPGVTTKESAQLLCAVQVSMAPSAPVVRKKPLAHADTRLVVALVQVYVASGAAFDTSVQGEQTLSAVLVPAADSNWSEVQDVQASQVAGSVPALR